MSIGIQLNIGREICHHFKGDGVDSTIIKRPKWWILGSRDYLTPVALESFDPTCTLPEVHSELSYSSDSAFSSGTTVLNLVPNPFTPSSDVQSDLDHLLGGEDLVVSRSMFVVRMSISSVTNDRFASYQALLDGIGHIDQLVTQTANQLCANHISNHTYWTLGGADLIMLCAQKSMNQLVDGMKLVQVLRQQRLSSVFGPQFGDSHVFSSVTGILCYANELHTAGIDESDQSDTEFTSRITVAPGHEKRFVEENDGKYFLTWGERSIHGKFESFEKCYSALVNNYWDSSDQSTHNRRWHDFDGSNTEVLFSVDEITDVLDDSWQHAPVELSSEALKVITNFEKSVNIFSSRFLGPHQESELSKIVETLKQGFVRSERVGAIRDLLPYIRQLGCCLSEPRWADYFPDHHALEDTSSTLSRVLGFIWRAIRNRIENRIENLDPSFPTTLDNGVGKLVNGYSIVAWICWDLFTRDDMSPVGSDAEQCSAENFAACVCSGSAGRVECEEAFFAFREFVEGKEGWLTNRPLDRWNSRLLLLNISGPVLYNPEAAFVHSMHEMAEYSDWVLRSPSLCEALNTHASDVFEVLIEQQMEASSSVMKCDVSARSTFELMHKTILAACAMYPSIQLNQSDPPMAQPVVSSWNEVLQLRYTELIMTHPTAVMNDHMRACLTLSNSHFRDRIRQLPEIEKKPDFDAMCHDIDWCLRLVLLAENDLFEDVALHSDLIGEIAADFGMVSCLDCLLEIDWADLALHVNYAFCCMVQSVYGWLPCNRVGHSALERIIVRWAVQHRTLHDDDSYDGWRAQFFEDVNHGVAFALSHVKDYESDLDVISLATNAIEKVDQFLLLQSAGRVECLATRLAKVLGQNKNASSHWMPSKSSVQGEILEQFLVTWKHAVASYGTNVEDPDKLIDLRFKLAFVLWAKSQKLGPKKIFK